MTFRQRWTGLALVVLGAAGSSDAQVAPAAPAAASTEATPAKPVIRSGETLLCKASMGCLQEGTGDARVLVMQVDGLTVKARLEREPHQYAADVTVTNGTQLPVLVNPAEFRIEVNAPKFGRLSYVVPRRRPQRKMKEEVHDLPPPDYFTSAAHERDKQEEAAAVPLEMKDLERTTLAPTKNVEGRVFFKGSAKATSLSLFVPISGYVFEFPYEPGVGN